MEQRRAIARSFVLCAMCVFGLGACKQSEARPSKPAGPASAEAKEAEKPEALSTVSVDHGELDTKAPLDSPKVAATVIAATIYKLPNTESRRLGYIRLGGTVKRDRDPVDGKGCEGGFYRVYPMGYVCTEEVTTDLEAPLIRASARRPALDKPLPYAYGFVRATAPQYLRIPTKEEQLKSEFKLEEHLQWFVEHKTEVQTVVLGANDVPLDTRGIPVFGLKGRTGSKLSTELSRAELFGAETADDPPPFWLQGGRQIPNVSGFVVPDYAVFADRVRRKTGLSFVGAFNTSSEGLERRFAITVDLRLIPTTKVKPDTGSPFHGLEISDKTHMPFGWVNRRDRTAFKLIKGKDEARPAEPLPRRAIVPLTGQARIEEGKRFYQTLKDPTRWIAASDLSIVAPPPEWPEAALSGEKWIDVSIRQQTLVLYEGKHPFYATMVSTGRDRFGDPEESLATPLGTFRLKSKHIAAAMDSEENSTVAGGQRSRRQHFDAEAQATIARLKAAKKAGKALSEEDERRWINIEKGRHPEYGVTRRRGSVNFELRDVPWIQYFASGYALHGTYWHDVFGIPRSHGCINLAPIDARVVFNWTDPPVPEGWHGVNIGNDMGQGTVVYVRP